MPRLPEARGQNGVGHAAMRVVLDAHLRIQPIRRAEHGAAVVGRLILDVEGQVDADLAQRVLDHDRVVRQLLEPLGGQPCPEPVGHAGLGEQLPGAGEVLVALRDGRIGCGKDRRKRANRCRARRARETCRWTRFSRLSESATARRTRLSANGPRSVRICSCSCALDFSATMLRRGSSRSAWLPWTGTCSSTSSWPPCMASTCAWTLS